MHNAHSCPLDVAELALLFVSDPVGLGDSHIFDEDVDLDRNSFFKHSTNSGLKTDEIMNVQLMVCIHTL